MGGEDTCQAPQISVYLQGKLTLGFFFKMFLRKLVTNASKIQYCFQSKKKLLWSQYLKITNLRWSHPLKYVFGIAIHWKKSVRTLTYRYTWHMSWGKISDWKEIELLFNFKKVTLWNKEENSFSFLINVFKMP